MCIFGVGWGWISRTHTGTRRAHKAQPVGSLKPGTFSLRGNSANELAAVPLCTFIARPGEKYINLIVGWTLKLLFKIFVSAFLRDLQKHHNHSVQTMIFAKPLLRLCEAYTGMFLASCFHLHLLSTTQRRSWTSSRRRGRGWHSDWPTWSLLRSSYTLRGKNMELPSPDCRNNWIYRGQSKV